MTDKAPSKVRRDGKGRRMADSVIGSKEEGRYRRRLRGNFNMLRVLNEIFKTRGYIIKIPLSVMEGGFLSLFLQEIRSKKFRFLRRNHGICCCCYC